MKNKHFPHCASLDHLSYKVALYTEQRVLMQDYLLDKITHCAKLAAYTPNSVYNSIQRKHLLGLYNQIK